MPDLFRDSAVGQLINIATKAHLLPFPEQDPSWHVPSLYTQPRPSRSSRSSTATKVPDELDLAVTRDLMAGAPKVGTGQAVGAEQAVRRDEKEIGHGDGKESMGVEPNGDLVVDWYGPDDPAHPHNWSTKKKTFITAQLMLLTFGIYAGSSIYTPSIPGIMQEFDVSIVAATGGLSCFIFGYALGPLIFSPLQEIPRVGRLPVYLGTLAVFVLFTMGTALARNIGTVLVTRFFAGFFGSPALATGGATIADVWGNKPLFVPMAIGLWALGAVLGPVVSPAIGGFAAMNENWRWPNWILMFLGLAVLIILSFSFPETNHATILYHRAQRLKARTGDGNLRSQGEKDQARLTLAEMTRTSLLRPILISLDPAPLFLGIYLGLVYAIFYLFFESFPLVFGDIYGFNLGEQGLAFFGYFVSAAMTYIGYIIYLKKRIEPLSRSGRMVPEDRLEIGLIGACIIPISTFIFGWTSRESVHWIVPVIGAALYLPGIYLIFQSLLVYIGTAYYTFAASAYAGNTLMRSVLAGSFPLFGHHFYTKLGLGPGSSVLGGISIFMILPLFLIKRYGAVLRSKSKYAPDPTPAPTPMSSRTVTRSEV